MTTTDLYAAALLDLNHSDVEIRLNAVKRLGTLHDLRAVPVLIQLLGAKEAPLRRQAVMAMAQLRDPQAIRPLIRVLESDSSVEDRIGLKFACQGSFDGLSNARRAEESQSVKM